jgi:hypothetical protein
MVVDLHGYPVWEAVEVATEKIREAWEKGFEQITLIHGAPDIYHHRIASIIDSTLPSRELVYFPELRFVGLRGLAEALAIPKPDYTTEDFPIFYHFGWGGADSPEFSQARRDEHRLAFGEPDEESRSSD